MLNLLGKPTLRDPLALLGLHSTFLDHETQNVPRYQKKSTLIQQMASE
jgi:hypothetical protein